MIKVNLLATAPGAATPREWMPREQRAAALGLLMLLVTGLGVAGWWYYLYSQRSAVEAQIAENESRLVQLKQAAALVEKVTARRAELSERMDLIERLRTAKRGPVSLLETISTSLPEGLWLLEMKQQGTVIVIDGRATSLTAVTDFAEHLQDSGLFLRPVEIITTNSEIFEESTVIRFALRAEVAAPAPSVTPAASATPARPGA
jgi:type IV pilus assembly protein PilN